MKDERKRENDVIDDPMGMLERVCGERGIDVIREHDKALFNEGTIAYSSVTNTLVICDTATSEDLLVSINHIGNAQRWPLSNTEGK